MHHLRKNISIGAAALLVLLMALPAMAGVVISEVDYDQPSTDAAEWLELHNPDAADMPLTGLELVLYNGTLSGTCAEYCRIDLDPYTIPAGGYIVLGQHPCAVAPLCATSNAIQNGAPDAIAVEDRATGGVVDSVEYESDLVNTVCNLNMTDAADSGAEDGSIQLCNGAWQFFTTMTPCAANACDPVPTGTSSMGMLKGSFGN